MTNTILNYAQGKLSHEEFEAELYLHPELWAELQSLMPEDAADPACLLWTYFPNRKLLEDIQFRIRRMEFGEKTDESR